MLAHRDSQTNSASSLVLNASHSERELLQSFRRLPPSSREVQMCLDSLDEFRTVEVVARRTIEALEIHLRLCSVILGYVMLCVRLCSKPCSEAFSRPRAQEQASRRGNPKPRLQYVIDAATKVTKAWPFNSHLGFRF